LAKVLLTQILFQKCCAIASHNYTAIIEKLNAHPASIICAYQGIPFCMNEIIDCDHSVSTFLNYYFCWFIKFGNVREQLSCFFVRHGVEELVLKLFGHLKRPDQYGPMSNKMHPTGNY
jgi:hypothetical protein